jgi:PAS domain S-box-containing protein
MGRLKAELEQAVAARTRQLETVNRQQAAVVALAQAAIHANGLAALIDKAAAIMAETLGTEQSAVLELLPDRAEVVLRAGVGWKEGLVGRHTLPAGAGTSPAFILASDAPVVVPDTRKETRFDPPPAWLEHGVISALNVIIRGRIRPWGILGVGTTRQRTFCTDDVAFLQSVANLLTLAVERHDFEVAQRREKEERKQSERALRESEAMFRQIAENINEVFWLAGPDLVEVFYVSPAYEQVFGRSRESLYRELRSWLEAIHPEDRERIRRAVFEKRSDDSLDETYRVVRPDGSIRWIRDRGFPIRDGSGEVYRFAGVAEDITERRRVEDERARLFESETRARAEAEAALERLRAIESITDAALSNLGLDDLLRELLARLRHTLQLELASVRLIDEERKELYVRAVDGVPLERVAQVGIPLDAAHLDAPFLVNDVQPPAPGQNDWYAKAWSALNMPLRAGMSTPLVVEGKPIGIVGVTSTRAPFTEAASRCADTAALADCGLCDSASAVNSRAAVFRSGRRDPVSASPRTVISSHCFGRPRARICRRSSRIASARRASAAERLRVSPRS